MTIRLLMLLISTSVLFSCGEPANNQPDKLAHSTSNDSNTAHPPELIDTSKNVFPASVVPKRLPALADRQVSLPVTSIAEDLKSISKPFQSFVVNNTADTTITCREGTVISIKANTLVLASDPGQAASHVVIAVKEFYSINDMLVANLSTTSGDAILETGGMIFIEAKASGGKQCKLREGEFIDIMLPCKQPKEGMQLFFGEWKNNVVDWALSENQNVAPKGSYVMFQDHEKVREYLERNLRYPYLDTALFINVLVKFDVGANGRVEKVIVTTPVRKDFESQIIAVLRRMPPVRPATNNGKPMNSSVDLQIVVATRTDSEMSRLVGDQYIREFEKTMDSASLNSLYSRDVSRYIFSASKLGWINCDRFPNDQRPRFNYAVNTGEYEDLDVKLIFSSIKGIMPGERITKGFQFRQVPEGEKVTIVAIKKINGAHYFATAKSAISTTPFDGLDFKQVTIQQLKEQMKLLAAN